MPGPTIRCDSVSHVERLPTPSVGDKGGRRRDPEGCPFLSGRATPEAPRVPLKRGGSQSSEARHVDDDSPGCRVDHEVVERRAHVAIG